MAVLSRNHTKRMLNSLTRVWRPLRRDGPCWRIGVALGTAALLVCGLPQKAHAVPETWFDPTHTFTGSASSGFGSAVACSASVGGLGHSYFAVGAPQANSGKGLVYIYGPSGRIQELQPTTLGGSEFGYAVAFTKDINGDSIDELVVGQPNPNLSSGSISMFLSTGNLNAPYSSCGTVSESGTLGGFVAQTSINLAGGVQIVGASLSAARLYAFDVTDTDGVCSFAPSMHYGGSGIGGAGSRYGQSFSEIDTGGEDFNLLVSAPYEQSQGGRIYAKPASGLPTTQYTGSANEQWGVAVASRPDSTLLGFSAPYASPGNDTLYIKSQSMGAFFDYCSADIPMSDLPDTAGQSLVHLSTVFDDFMGGVLPGQVFGSYRSEALTGGSVALIGTQSGTCTGPKLINNCAFDAGQKQGYALAGGPSCVTSGGVSVLIVGSPGFSSNAGRVDIYAEGTELGSPVICQEPTSTPTPTPTSTPTPNTPPTAPPTATAAPGFEGPPIPVEPKTPDLPEPRADVAGKNVTVTAPSLVSASKNFKLLGYLFLVTTKSSSIAALTVETLGASSKKREIFNKRNRISLRNLKPGTYTVSYRAVFQRSRAKTRVLGKVSRPTTFTVRP